MKKIKLWAICLICCLGNYFNVLGQGYYYGRVIDENNLSIPYCSIGIFGTNKGVVSDENGMFKIAIDQLSNTDSIRISHVSYVAKLILASNLSQSQSNRSNISLAVKNIELSDVKVFDYSQFQKKTQIAPKRIFESVTLSLQGDYLTNDFGEVFGNLIHLKKKILLENVSFGVNIDDSCDYVLFRLVLKNIENGQPSSDILQQEIFLKTTESGWQVLDLSDQFIVVESDFFIGLEYLKFNGCNVPVYTAKGKITRPYNLIPSDFEESVYRLSNTSGWKNSNFAKYSIKIEALQSKKKTKKSK